MRQASVGGVRLFETAGDQKRAEKLLPDLQIGCVRLHRSPPTIQLQLELSFRLELASEVPPKLNHTTARELCLVQATGK